MKQTRLKHAALVLALTLALTQGSPAASLNAMTNAQTVAVGDQFQLTVTTDNSVGAMPDLTPLQQDFQIHGTSQSMRTRIINGQQSQERSWIISLSPKETGRLVIPELSAAGLTSQALAINVLEPSAMPKSQGVKGVAIEASLAHGSHYLYQEIPLVVRIETPLGIKKAELIAPSGDDFELTRNGQDHTSTIVKNGQTLSVIERHYHLRPQKTGPVTLAPFTIRGEVDDPNARRNPFGNMPFGSSLMRDFPFGGSAFGSSVFNDMFSTGAPFVARTDALSLNVETAAGTESGEWFLPARTVELKSQWQPENPEFNVGEAVTRQIDILALGARPEQLPELEFETPSGARIYIDGSTTDEFSTAEGTIGRRTIMTSIVPTQGGQVTLPEITMKWWDTGSGEAKTARIAAETIQVSGAAGPVENSAAQPSQTVEPPLVAIQNNTSMLNEWTLAAGAGILALIVALGWLHTRKQKPVSSAQPEVKTRTNKKAASASRQQVLDALSSLRVASKSGNALKTYHAALNWQRSIRPDQVIPVSFGAELLELESLLYRPVKTSSDWDSRKLLKIAESVSRASGTIEKKGSVLPALYPDGKHLSDGRSPQLMGI